ncbi:MAG: hypothetical protein IPG45_27970 [Deltaproteobacteria bacterium]|nr:hypothetical protein [Deltaproteobacteria bacterium]
MHILLLSGPAGAASWWRCTGVEAFGPLADELNCLADRGSWIEGERLYRLAEGILQVVDGDFVGAAEPGAEPWIRIKAVDSSFFFVTTKDGDLIARIKATYSDVRDSLDDDV